MVRAGAAGIAVLALLAAGPAPRAADPVPADGECERGKGIERALGKDGYRVAVAGGFEGNGDGAVKLQVWENDDQDWVITERFMEQKRTCVVRSGRGLHVLYDDPMQGEPAGAGGIPAWALIPAAPPATPR